MKKLKILCPEPENFSEHGLKLLASLGHLDARSISQEEFELAAPHYDVLAIRLQKHVSKKMLSSCKNLKAIISPTTGTDHIDMVHAEQSDVKIFCLRGEYEFLKGVTSSAEHTFALLLCLVRCIPSSFDSVKQYQWVQTPFRGHELQGKVLGILGYGRIGAIMAHYGQAFGMKVITYDPYVHDYNNSIEGLKSLEDLLRTSDILSIHVPLNPTTYQLIGKKEISMMKRGAILVNTSRGAIIDYLALLHSLETKQLGGAAIDVLMDEPSLNETDRKLIEYAKNNNKLIITPHIAGATWEGIEKTDLFVIGKFKEWLKEEYMDQQ